MKKLLIISNHYPIQPRLNKIIKSIENLNLDIDIRILAWNRNNNDVEQNENIVTFDSNEGYGKKIKKLLGMFKFYKELKSQIESFEPDYIQAIDWDMLFLVNLCCKTEKIIYEVYDIPNSNNNILQFIMSLLEKISLKKVEKIILASPFFKEIYKNLSEKIYVLNNKPNKSLIDLPEGNNKCNEKLTLGYIGIIRNFDILTRIVDVASEKKINVLFAGDGPEYNKIKEYCYGNNYINFIGRYEYKDIKKIYNQCDVIWAAYPAKNKNVKLAISNRFFESNVLETPGIYSAETELGKYVEKNNIGFTVNPYDREEIANLFERLISHKECLLEVKRQIKLGNEYMFWEEEEKVLKQIYT